MAAAVFLGAFLLFQVQPLIGKFILPWFGGAPAVWTTCLLFFQALLLCGYAYAHFAMRWLSLRTQAVVHCALLAGALAFVPTVPGESWKPTAVQDPTGRILVMLAACVGLPYVVLSATGPLIQGWFHRLNPTRSPYRLYALSNLGSLLALISYPLLVEPNLPRKVQANVWSIGLGAFALLCGYCAIRAARASEVSGAQAVSPARRAGIGARLLWILLPAAASALLLATTNKICQDVSAVPLLWIVPLAVYLISFVVTFDHPRWYPRAAYIPLLFAASVIGVWLLVGARSIPIRSQEILYNLVLLVACMVAHGEVVRLKPDPAGLGTFYLSLALGGTLGALGVAVGAPLLFKTFAEYPLAILGCCILASIAVAADRGSAIRRRGVARALTVLLVGWLIAFAALGAILMVGLHALPTTSERVIHRTRNFYGVLATVEGEVSAADSQGPTSGPYRKLIHGATEHGFQFLEPSKARLATSYYGAGSGVELAIRLLPGGRTHHIGVVGLGAGTLATYAERGDSMTFYEINPAVVSEAETYFTFLRDCRARLGDEQRTGAPARLRIELGDARLVLGRQPPPQQQQFDLLVLDAFSGDAIPVHLVTREAFELYLRHVKPGGVACINVTNHHLDLRPVVTQIAAALNLKTAIISNDPNKGRSKKQEAFAASDWILIARDAEVLNQEIVAKRKDPPQPFRAVKLWTDEYSSLFSVLR